MLVGILEINLLPRWLAILAPGLGQAQPVIYGTKIGFGLFGTWLLAYTDLGVLWAVTKETDCIGPKYQPKRRTMSRCAF